MITRAQDGVVIGNCGIRMTERGAREAEFGCELDPRHWRRGFPIEAGRAILFFGFERLKLYRVFSRVIAANAAACRLALRLGMKRERRFRKRRSRWDTVRYAVLECDTGDSGRV